MVVEDSDDTRNILMEFLVLKGCRVVEADNGKEAVVLIKRKCPDVILMDLHLPLMDGLTATSQIRQYRDTCSDVPIIAITAYDGSGVKESALDAGCNEYLTKPIDFPLLEKTLHNILETRPGASEN
jgi:two-component system, cell cycle response regulator DivK